MAREFAQTALTDQKAFYNSRFKLGYMQGFDYDVYEPCRLRTFHHTLRRMKAAGFAASAILDYGCGEGRYIGELRKLFPTAELNGCDISDVGISISSSRYPDAAFRTMTNEATTWPDNSFDLVISIEVLEHVADVAAAVKEIGRVLKPGGIAFITTPCANRFSLEWTMQKLTGGLLPSPDGFGRFASDEPGHLRRLDDEALQGLLSAAGLTIRHIHHRAHLFGTLVEMRFIRRLPRKLRVEIAMLDWHLFRRLSNGATLLAVAEKA